MNEGLYDPDIRWLAISPSAPYVLYAGVWDRNVWRYGDEITAIWKGYLPIIEKAPTTSTPSPTYTPTPDVTPTFTPTPTATYEQEPNDTPAQANGPLRPNHNYLGLASFASYSVDEIRRNDYFYFDAPGAGTITVHLTDYAASLGQLQLHFQAVPNLITDPLTLVPGVSATIKHAGQAGRYYVRIVTLEGPNATDPYTLQVNYP